MQTCQLSHVIIGVKLEPTAHAPSKTMARNTAFLLIFSLLSIFAATSSEFYNVIPSQDFNEVKKSKEIVAVSFVRTIPSYSEAFQSHFSKAGDYLKDFGVVLGTVDCVSDPVSEYCLQADASKNIYIFRHGHFFITLAYDTLFSIDAIVSNILHLVLLVDVPIIAGSSDLLEKQDQYKGKKDIIVGYVPAVGTTADRAFMEVAFAYRHKYVFLVTTNKNLLEEDAEEKPSMNRLPDPVVAISQCSKAAPHQDCLWAKYYGPVTLESLAIMMKVLGLPSVVDISEKGQTDVYKEHGISALYAITDPTNHERALSLIMDVKDQYQGNLGFVVIDRDDVSDTDMLADLNEDCIPACFVLLGHDQSIIGEDIHNALDLKVFIETNIHHVFSNLDNPSLEDDHDEMGEDEEDDGELPVQERQDDLVQEATVHLQLLLEPKKSIIPSLTDKTFPEFTGQSHLTSVLFTMQWNPRSLAFLESFESAAESILNFFSSDSQEPPLARVECSDWPDVCDKSNVTVYPTVKMYRGQSDVATYGGILDKNNVLKSYLLYKLSNPINLKDADEVKKAVEGSYPVPWIKDYMTSFILAVIPEQHQEERAVFRQVAEKLRGDYLFGLCTSQCAQQVLSSSSDQDKPSVTIMKWNDPTDPKQSFIDEFTPENLEAFIKEASLPVLPELTASSMPVYLAKKKPFVILFHAGDQISEKAVHSMRQMATSKIGNQFIMCQMDISDEESVGSQTLTTYGFLPISDEATIVILDHAQGEVCRCPHGNDPSESALTDWLEVSQESPKQCSEARALMDREWKPLVPPYDFLKFMEDEEHSKGAGRRGLVVHHDDVIEGTEDQQEEKAEQGAKDSAKVDVEMKETQKHFHKHIEL